MLGFLISDKEFHLADFCMQPVFSFLGKKTIFEIVLLYGKSETTSN
jgi:hypothetical protein